MRVELNAYFRINNLDIQPTVRRVRYDTDEGKKNLRRIRYDFDIWCTEAFVQCQRKKHGDKPGGGVRKNAFDLILLSGNVSE